LLDEDLDAALAVAARLRLSNAQSDRLTALVAPDQRPDRAMQPKQLRRLLYGLGVDRFRDLTLLGWAAARSKEGYAPQGDTARWMTLLDLADQWRAPVFPLGGKDLIDIGVAPGPEMGRLLKQAEDIWLEEDFRPDRKALLARLK